MLEIIRKMIAFSRRINDETSTSLIKRRVSSQVPLHYLSLPTLFSCCTSIRLILSFLAPSPSLHLSFLSYLINRPSQSLICAAGLVAVVREQVGGGASRFQIGAGRGSAVEPQARSPQLTFQARHDSSACFCNNRSGGAAALLRSAAACFDACNMVVISAMQPFFQELFLQPGRCFTCNLQIFATRLLFQELFLQRGRCFCNWFVVSGIVSASNRCFCNWFVVSEISVSRRRRGECEELDRTARARRSDGCRGGGD